MHGVGWGGFGLLAMAAESQQLFIYILLTEERESGVRLLFRSGWKFNKSREFIYVSGSGSCCVRTSGNLRACTAGRLYTSYFKLWLYYFLFSIRQECTYILLHTILIYTHPIITPLFSFDQLIHSLYHILIIWGVFLTADRVGKGKHFFIRPQIANPQILGLIPQSKIRKFLRYSGPQIRKGFFLQIEYPQITT